MAGAAPSRRCDRELHAQGRVFTFLGYRARGERDSGLRSITRCCRRPWGGLIAAILTARNANSAAIGSRAGGV